MRCSWLFLRNAKAPATLPRQMDNGASHRRRTSFALLHLRTCKVCVRRYGRKGGARTAGAGGTGPDPLLLADVHDARHERMHRAEVGEVTLVGERELELI